MEQHFSCPSASDLYLLGTHCYNNHHGEVSRTFNLATFPSAVLNN